MLARDEPVVTKCRKCGRKRECYVLGGKKTKVYRKGKCWDAGMCGKCAAKDKAFFEANYRPKEKERGYTVAKDKPYTQDIKSSSNGFLAPRFNRTIPSVNNINKASGQRLVTLLERKIGEIYG